MGVSFKNYTILNVDADQHVPTRLPKSIRTIDDPDRLTEISVSDGIVFNHRDAGPKLLSFDRYEILDDQTFVCLCGFIVNALEHRKTSTVCRWNGKLKHFLEAISKHCSRKIASITLDMFLFYTEGESTPSHKLIRSVLKYWACDTKLPGVAPDLKHYLLCSKAPKSKSPIELQSHNPNERSISKSLISSVVRKLDSLYMNSQFNHQDYCLWKLLVSEALRPSQLRLLHCEDVKILGDRVELSVPIVKQKGTPARELMIQTTLSDGVGKAVLNQMNFIKEVTGCTSLYGFPLFCIRNQYSTLKANKKYMGIDNIIKNTKKLIQSDGLEDLEIFSRRLKHTKLTHISRHTNDRNILARAGYQTSSISLLHYIDVTEEEFTNFEQKLSSQYQILIDGFAGKLINKPLDVDEGSVIYSTNVEDEVGDCQIRGCGAFAPIACYDCEKFNPFIEGDHESVLEFLLQKKNKRIEMGLPVEIIERDDHLILNVKVVIQAIGELNE